MNGMKFEYSIFTHDVGFRTVESGLRRRVTRWMKYTQVPYVRKTSYFSDQQTENVIFISVCVSNSRESLI